MGDVRNFKRDIYRREWSHVVARMMLWFIVIASIVFFFVSFVSARVLIDGRDFFDLGSAVNSTTYVNNSYYYTYDDTGIQNRISAVNSSLSNYYLDSNPDGFITSSALANYLLITDQRFNDTGYIIGELANYLLITDQRFNDTGAINYLAGTSLRNFGDQTLFGSLTINGNLTVVGSYVNLTVINQIVNGSILPSMSGLFDLGSPSQVWNNVYVNNLFAGNIYNKSEIDSLIAGVNITTFIENNNTFIFNYTYDDSLLWAFFSNYYNTSEIDSLIAGINFTNGTLYYFASPYLVNDGLNNISLNESMLNFTINNISKNRKGVYNVILYDTSSVISTNISYLITAVKVFTSSANYHVQVTEYPSGLMVERDRIPHNGDWLIEKNYAIDGMLNISTIGSGTFNVSIEYITNGVE